MPRPARFKQADVTRAIEPRGLRLPDAAGYVGMTKEVLERVYGHHHPDHMSGAVNAR